jgi:hypothetical protein
MGLKKQVIQLKDGEQIAVYNSATEAAMAVGSTKSNISKCCSGILKQVNGFTFKYTGECTNHHRNDGEFKCPYCNNRFVTYDGLCKHIFKHKSHGDSITKEQLLTDVKYNGIRPTCKCGCGEYTSISYVGGAHFGDYVIGHASRVHNNWGHNETAKNHSADTRRRQYANGERIQWNKGKNWEKTYSDDEIKKLMKQYLNKERNNKISKALKGIPKSPEHAEKCRENGKSENSIAANRKKMHERLMSGEFSLSSNAEKKFVKDCIEPLGIEYTTQHYIKEIRHYCDVFIPKRNIIVEFQGDYWHGNPKKYTREELSPYQIDKVKKDEALRMYCSEHNIRLIEVWESDYNRDPGGTKKLLEESI